MREIEISLSETNHKTAREYAIVFDNGLVRLRRTVRNKLTGEEVTNENSALTIQQFKELAAAL